MNPKLVSILIPTRNSAPHLAQCIASLRAQENAQLEIIVIDNNSTDGTQELAGNLADVVLTAGPERCVQLNAGARAAQGAYLYRVDGDFVVDPRVVSTAVERCESGYDAVEVDNVSSPDVSVWSRIRNFERLMYRGDAYHTAARFFTKAAFEAVGGFNESLVAGEDYDIHNRLLSSGYKITRIEPTELHLGEPRTLREFAAKSYYYGRSVHAFLRANGARGVRQMSPVRGAFFRHWRRFARSPSLGAGLVFLQIVKYACGAAGFLAVQIESLVRTGWRRSSGSR